MFPAIPGGYPLATVSIPPSCLQYGNHLRWNYCLTSAESSRSHTTLLPSNAYFSKRRLVCQAEKVEILSLRQEITFPLCRALCKGVNEEPLLTLLRDRQPRLLRFTAQTSASVPFFCSFPKFGSPAIYGNDAITTLDLEIQAFQLFPANLG